MPADLAAFITERLDEAEATARAATPGPWKDDGSPACMVFQPAATRGVAWCSNGPGDEDLANSAHIAANDPARVLRSITATRAILALHYPGLPPEGAPDGMTICAGEEADGDTWQMATPWPCHTARVIAAIYSDHPDYLPEWAPEPATAT